MTDTPTPTPQPTARVGSVELNMGQALARRHADLYPAPAPEETPEQARQIQNAIRSLLPQGMQALFNRALQAATPNELAQASTKPEELKPPVPLDVLERTVRESPELSRAIAAITVGVGSRNFLLQGIDAELAGENEDEAKLENEDLTAFFKHLSPKLSFSQVMRITVSARKKFGFAAWEVLRNAVGNPNGVNPIEDVKTLRYCLVDEAYTPVERTIRVGSRTETLTEQRRFRRYKQITRGALRFGGKTVYFKEFGDPRFLNRETGEYWTGPGLPPASFPFATELLVFACVDAGGEHPLPEWLPILPDALASYAIRVINLDTLNNGATPPFMVIIEGTVSDAQLKKVMDEFKDIQGQTSRRRAIFVQVDSQSVGSGTAKEVQTASVRIEPMAQLMTTEGMFLKYLMWLEKSIASALRLPLLLVGNIDSTLNRATAEAALVFAEDQVFSPERQDIEDIINDVFLPEVVLFSNQISQVKGVKYWRFKLGSYSADRTADYLKLLAFEKGSLSLNERRTIIDALLPDQKLQALDEERANTPWALLSAKVPGLETLPNEAQATQVLKTQIAQQLNISPSRIRNVGIDIEQEAA